MKTKKYLFTLEYQVEMECKNEAIAREIMATKKPFINFSGYGREHGHYSASNTNYFNILSCQEIK